MASYGPITNLTPGLAVVRPSEYKEGLVESLKSDTEFGYPVWAFLERLGRVSMSGLELDPARWESEALHDGDGIILGTQDLPPETKDYLLFESRRFSYADAVRHRFCHEMAHKLTPLIWGPLLENVYRVIVHTRQNQEIGLSTLGNLKCYENKGVGYQATEDIIELLTMYIQDPHYLKRFFFFLQDRAYYTKRQNLRLATITDSQAGMYINAVISTISHPDILRFRR